MKTQSVYIPDCDEPSPRFLLTPDRNEVLAATMVALSMKNALVLGVWIMTPDLVSGRFLWKFLLN